ncbi:MAG: glycerol-3-phosphate dehydrogenase subunit GlpB [Deltaproteobacteria bacterium]|nr:glycerol-3-phosphate dehydrogenase subunit GlpB [Deltaproteobacteria bacterium]
MLKSNTTSYDLTIIGAGMAGMAAALFAANRGISCVQIGQTGGIVFSSGLLDLMGVHPIRDRKSWTDPWAAIRALKQDLPQHPYSRLSRAEIQAAFDELTTFLAASGLPYNCHQHQNSEVITSLGTTKLSYCVPTSMWNGVQALKEKAACLVIGFEGMKDFSARQIATTIKDRWPDIQSCRLAFPGTVELLDLQPENMARLMEQPTVRAEVIKRIKPLLNGAKSIGLPAILGLNFIDGVISDLENELGVPVFEIPTMPVSIPGYRLLVAFEKHLVKRGVQQLLQKKVYEVSGGLGEDFYLTIGDQSPEIRFQSKAVLLASGRFLGKGLVADRQEIQEAIFGLPVSQPEARSKWYEAQFFNPNGHEACRAGLEIDDQFRPLDRSAQPAYPSLYAAGSILAHQDWTRMKCGAGLSIASAYKAIEAFSASNNRGT